MKHLAWPYKTKRIICRQTVISPMESARDFICFVTSSMAACVDFNACCYELFPEPSKIF